MLLKTTLVNEKINRKILKMFTRSGTNWPYKRDSFFRFFSHYTVFHKVYVEIMKLTLASIYCLDLIPTLNFVFQFGEILYHRCMS